MTARADHEASRPAPTYSGGSRNTRIVPLRSSGSKLPLICIHGMSGTVGEFEELAAELGPDQPVYAIQGPPAHDLATRFTSVELLAEHYAKALQALQLGGPYILAGYSMGGRIAIALAHYLRLQNRDVRLVILLDSRSYIGRRLPPIRKRMAQHVHRLRGSGGRDRILYIASQVARIRLKLVRKSMRHYHRHIVKRSLRRCSPVPEHFGVRLHLYQKINGSYTADCYDGPVILIKVDRSYLHPDVHDGWRRILTGEFRVHTVSGRHLTILTRPHVQEVASVVARAVENVTHDTRQFVSERPDTSTSQCRPE